MTDTYSILREFADSWIMLAIFGFFIGAVIWAFRPGGGKEYQDAMAIPFRHDDKPAEDAEPLTKEAR